MREKMDLNIYYSLYNYFKTGRLAAWGLNLAKLTGIRRLLVRMDTNFVCNLRCKTCFFSSPNAEKLFIPPMNLAFFKTIAKDVFPKTRILFLSCGAEPLMTNDFDDFLEVTAKYSVPYIGYATNGLLLSERIIRSSIECRVSEITISIDGATKETYEYIRTRSNFDKLLDNLALYKDIVSKAKGRVPSLRFNFTASRANYFEMPMLVDLAKRFGVSVIKFRIYTNWGGEFSFHDNSLIGVEKAFNDSLSEAKKRALDAKIHIISPKEFSLNTKEKSQKNMDAIKNNVSHPPCIYPWFFRYINPLGAVRVCACLPLSEVKLSEHFTLKDFEKSSEESNRRRLLCKHPYESCFANICNGFYLKRANDDVNFLKQNNV
jgi:MoaA/NifB/PqqE/SkfB family radical SAM enzyme